MTKNLHIIFGCLILWFLTLSAVTGCVKRELEQRPKEGYVEITLDWGAAKSQHPTCCLFYDESGNLVKEAMVVTGILRDTLLAGTYHLVVHNGDAMQVGYRGTDSHDTAEVFAQEVSAVGNAEHKPCILEPQMVFIAGSCQGIGTLTVEADKTLHRTVRPVSAVKQVRFQFTVKNVTVLESLAGMLDGIAPSMFIATGKSNFNTVCATEFTGIESEQNVYTVEMDVFDLFTSQQEKPGTNSMDIALKADGKQYDFTVDITDTLKEIMDENDGVIPVEVSIEMEITVKEMGGEITATVKPWNEDGSGSGTVQ